jgi:hypothetical protein
VVEHEAFNLGEISGSLVQAPYMALMSCSQSREGLGCMDSTSKKGIIKKIGIMSEHRIWPKKEPLYDHVTQFFYFKNACIIPNTKNQERTIFPGK